MHKVNYILLFSFVAIASSLPQITWQGREPGLSISQQIGDGIRNVPIPPPWYFLRNKYYWTTNTGIKTSTEGTRVVNKYNLNNGQIAKGYPAPDLTSRFNTIDAKTNSAKIEYVPHTTRPPKYQVPNTFVSLSTSPVVTSTEQVPSQTVFVPTYQPPVSTVNPSTTLNSVTTVQSTYTLPNEQPGSDPILTNAHSKPLYTSEYPNTLPEITTVIPELSTINNNGDQSSGSQLQTSTAESQVLEKEEKDLENLNIAVESTETTTINNNNSQTTGPDPLNYAINDTTVKEDIRRNASNDTENHNNNPGLPFSGPQICRKQNAYFGVGENHSFYVECNDYLPSVKLCPENYSFDSNVQWPEYPCKHITISIENQAQNIQ